MDISNIKKIAFAAVIAGLAGQSLADTNNIELTSNQINAVQVATVYAGEMPRMSDSGLNGGTMHVASESTPSDMPSASDYSDFKPVLSALSDNPDELVKTLTPASNNANTHSNVGRVLEKIFFGSIYVSAYKALTENTQTKPVEQQVVADASSDFNPQ